MEILIELINLVKKNRVDKIEVIGNSNEYTGKMKDLYDGIINSRFDNDNDALYALYGNEKISNRTYEKLKYRLQNRLINTLFFVDLNKPQFTDAQRAYYNCQKAFAAINILLGRGGRKTAIVLAERTLKQAIEYEHTEISLNLLKKLSRHYGVMEKNKNKFELYTKLTDKYLEIYNAETLAEQLHARIGWYMNETAATQVELEKTAINFCEKLEMYLESVDSNTFLRYAYYVFVNRFEIVSDYKNALLVCDTALEKFNNKKYKHNGSIYAFFSKKILCQIQLKEFEKAEKNILETLKRVQEGTINWFILYGKILKILFITKDYNKAYSTFYQVKNEVGFKLVYKNIVEIWNIYEAYIQFLIQIEKIDTSKSKDQPSKKFRINKFINEVPIYSKDKRGLNIPILIIQLLFLLQKKKYGEVIDKAEALNVYCYRHLKKDDTFRSNCFIKMLLVLPKGNFNRIAVIRKSKLLVEKLKSIPLEVARQSAEIEIIPYENLWEIVLNMLDNKFHKTKK